MGNYEELIRETEEITKRMALKWDIISAVLIVMLATLILLIVKMLWEDRKARRAVQAARSAGCADRAGRHRIPPHGRSGKGGVKSVYQF